MSPLIYFGVAILAGVVTSLSCALKKMVNRDSDSATDYPDSDSLDNRITTKRIAWMFVWIIQGVIGGLVVALSLADQVFKNELSVGMIWALSFIAGSVSWLDFKKSIAAIKELLKIGK